MGSQYFENRNNRSSADASTLMNSSQRFQV